MTTNCPVCREAALSERKLEENLSANHCGKCDGMWVSAAQYDQWRQKKGENLPEKSADQGINLESGEGRGAKFCPECQYLLVKYKVGHDLRFSLDRCGHCGGMWFDKNEWQILESRNLHDDVHLLFSQQWQAAVRAEEHRVAMDEIWRSHIGDADLSEIKRIKTWLEKHPKSAELYAYLLRDRDEARKSALAR